MLARVAAKKILRIAVMCASFRLKELDTLAFYTIRKPCCAILASLSAAIAGKTYGTAIEGTQKQKISPPI
jgi:hypothetical protein